MAKNSPTQRALAEIKKRGYTAQVVEKWNPHARIRQDLFGVIDIVALAPDHILAIQACAGASHSARREKALAEPRLRLWLAAGGRFEVWSFAKRGARGAPKLWTLRAEPLTLADLDEHALKGSEVHAVVVDEILPATWNNPDNWVAK